MDDLEKVFNHRLNTLYDMCARTVGHLNLPFSITDILGAIKARNMGFLYANSVF